MRASSCLLSWTWPPVRMKRSGWPSASTTALILVLGPPRERPIASSSVPLFCARCMLVCTDDSGIDDEVLVVRIFTQLVEDMLPNAVLRPSSETLELTVPSSRTRPEDRARALPFGESRAHHRRS